MDEIDKSDQPKSSNRIAPDRITSAIALILVITLSAISGVVVILLAIAVALNKVSFNEAKDILSLVLVVIGTLTGAVVGFCFGALGFNQGKNS
jgi:4-hydroxybenzoate polyprenyltransferase